MALLSNRKKGLFAEIGERQTLLARANHFEHPLEIEAVRVCRPGVTEPEEILEFAEVRRGNFAETVCGFYPSPRIFHRHTTDNPNKTKGDDFAHRVIREDLRLDPKEIRYHVLHPLSGLLHDPLNTPSREVLFVGAAKESILDSQRAGLDLGLFPRRLELAFLPLFAATRQLLVAGDLDASVMIIDLSDHAGQCFVVDRAGLALNIRFDHGLMHLVPIVQRELGLRDAKSAEKVFFSRTFDFGDMGELLLHDFIRQIKASTGQFEVTTGRSIGHLLMTNLSPELSWIQDSFVSSLGIEAWDPPIGRVLEAGGVRLQGRIEEFEQEAARWFPLACLMSRFGSEEATQR